MPQSQSSRLIPTPRLDAAFAAHVAALQAIIDSAPPEVITLRQQMLELAKQIQAAESPEVQAARQELMQLRNRRQRF